MAKCFFTGVEAPTKEMYVLDVSAAHRVLRDLRKRITVIERLVEQLGMKDDVELYDIRRRQSRTIRMFRMVSHRAAEVLAVAYPWQQLFVSWEEFRARLVACRQMRMASKVAELYGEEIASGSEDGDDV